MKRMSGSTSAGMGRPRCACTRGHEQRRTRASTVAGQREVGAEDRDGPRAARAPRPQLPGVLPTSISERASSHSDDRDARVSAVEQRGRCSPAARGARGPAKRNARLRITCLPRGPPRPSERSGRRRLFARRRHEHEHRFQAREVHRRRRVDVLVAPELALHDLRHARDRDAAREPLALAAGDEQVADLDLVARVDHLDLARVARRIARAAHEAARVRALVLDVDAERRVDGELHVHRVARDVQHGADDAVGRDHGHVRPDVARALVEHDARDAEELGEVLADDLRADGRLGHRVAELQQAPELAVLGLAPARATWTRSRRRALS